MGKIDLYGFICKKKVIYMFSNRKKMISDLEQNKMECKIIKVEKNDN